MGRGKKEGREGKRLRLRWTRATVSGLAFPGRFCRRSRDVPSSGQENPLRNEPHFLENKKGITIANIIFLSS